MSSLVADAPRAGPDFAPAMFAASGATLTNRDAMAVVIGELRGIIERQAAALRLWESTATQLCETIETLEASARLSRV